MPSLSNVFLVVLPCPRLLIDLLDVCMYCARKLLLLGGDIETNPGSDTASISNQLLQKIADDLKEIKENRLAAIDAKLLDLAGIDDKISSYVDQVNNLQKVIYDLVLKVDDLENRSRRSKLIIYGIPENEKEESIVLQEFVNDKIIKDVLKTEAVGIDRIHRLGRPRTNSSRPVILKLTDFREKTRLLKLCYRLKGSNYSVGEDFSVIIRNVRKMLCNFAKTRKAAGDKVSLSYDKLWINGEQFLWDQSKNQVVPIRPQNTPDARAKNQNSEPMSLRSRKPQQHRK